MWMRWSTSGLRIASRCVRTPCWQRFVATSTSPSSIRPLVIVEFEKGNVSSSTWSTLSAASKLTPTVDALVVGSDVEHVATQVLSASPVSRVLVVNNDACAHHTAAEVVSPILATLLQSGVDGYTHVFAPHSSFGKNLIPRVAASFDASPVSDVIEIKDSNTYVRPIYAGNALATVRCLDPIQFLTIRSTAFEKCAIQSSPAGKEAVPGPYPPFDHLTMTDGSSQKFVSEELSQSDRPELSTADRVVSGGRALKSKENFSLINDLADSLRAAVGASRAAVDAGYAPNDYQVGQTGKVVAPSLYVAVGISGAIQHLAGMKDSKVIVAINKDPEAPIFQVADYGLVADLFKAVPELTEKIRAASSS